MSVLTVFFLTLLLAHGSQFLLPRTLHPRALTAKSWLLQSAILSSIYLPGLLLTQRPLLSMLLTLSVLAVFLVVNHAKFQALREPLVFSDVYLYIQVISHPRLFLPFLNIPLTVSAILGGIMLLYLAVNLEPAAIRQRSSLLYFYPACLLLLLTSLWLAKKLALQTRLSLDPATDIQQYGFFNSLLSYTLQAGTNSNRQALQNNLQTHSPFTASAQRPRPSDIIIIQSESFFDARRLYPGITPAILENYDRIRATSLQHGTLSVPSWGANTLRPEFAFLSGIDNATLSYYRFNPYQYLQQQPTPTLASHLKQQGYYCIAVHPNSSAFFARDKVFPLFGFDEFIDINDFDTTATSGPYISDHAVQHKITEVMDQYKGGKPLFIFVITMENHGPLHLESVTQQEANSYYQDCPPVNHADFSVYLRHLSNADRMLKNLTDYLQQREQEALLCFYGDHVPSMPKVYAELEFTDGRTDYLLWHNQRKNTAQAGNSTPLRVEALPLVLLSALQQDGE
jgi:phosphoglycerol transferase MdoB-like AlkP superfamily enzyme